VSGKAAQRRSGGIEVSAVIKAAPSRVLKAFFDANALGSWWRVARSVTTPRVLGAYAIEWGSTDFEDDILGRLGGVFHGTVMQFDAEQGFFVADAFWLPPDGDPIGPMALEVTCTPVVAADTPVVAGDTPVVGGGTPVVAAGTSAVVPGDAATEVRIVQSGFDKSARWERYYAVAGAGWERALTTLRMLLEA
jgi:uncharacterized protein YndB with AHSA1/START domain